MEDVELVIFDLAGTTVEVKKTDIKDQRPDKVSMMPEGLLSVLKKEEVLDLLAYLLSRGDPNHPMFKKEAAPPKRGGLRK